MSKQLHKPQRLTIWIPALLAAACATSGPAERPARQPPAVQHAGPSPALEAKLYPADEALRDALSGELEYVGTGRWPGIERSRACVFRNDRVFVVIAYCTVTETPAFRIDVFSPERGRVRIYAEANGPVSKVQRGDYFTFMAESEPPPGPEARTSGVELAMSFNDLQRYDEQRYNAYLPGCYGGERHDEKVGGCLGALAPRAREFASQNGAFLDNASPDWYRAVRQMRELATRHGRDPD